eukprot:321526-Chlamydomonas_euryale.AAC.1
MRGRIVKLADGSVTSANFHAPTRPTCRRCTELVVTEFVPRSDFGLSQRGKVPLKAKPVTPEDAAHLKV